MPLLPTGTGMRTTSLLLFHELLCGDAGRPPPGTWEQVQEDDANNIDEQVGEDDFRWRRQAGRNENTLPEQTDEQVVREQIRSDDGREFEGTPAAYEDDTAAGTGAVAPGLTSLRPPDPPRERGPRWRAPVLPAPHEEATEAQATLFPSAHRSPSSSSETDFSDEGHTDTRQHSSSDLTTTEGEPPTESSLLEQGVRFSSGGGASVQLENLESPSDYCKRTDHASSSACSELVPHSTDRQYGSHIVSPIVCAPLGDKAAVVPASPSSAKEENKANVDKQGAGGAGAGGEGGEPPSGQGGEPSRSPPSKASSFIENPGGKTTCSPPDVCQLSERDGRNSPKWYFPGYSKSAVEHAQDRGADICTPRPCEEIVFDTHTDIDAEKMRRTRICMNVERLTRETTAVKKWPDYLCMFGEHQLYLLPAGPLILSRYSYEADGCKVVPADDPLTEAEKKKDKENFYDNEKAVAEMFIDEQLTDFSGYHQGEKAVAAAEKAYNAAYDAFQKSMDKMGEKVKKYRRRVAMVLDLAHVVALVEIPQLARIGKADEVEAGAGAAAMFGIGTSTAEVGGAGASPPEHEAGGHGPGDHEGEGEAGAEAQDAQGRDAGPEAALQLRHRLARRQRQKLKEQATAPESSDDPSTDTQVTTHHDGAVAAWFNAKRPKRGSSEADDSDDTEDDEASAGVLDRLPRLKETLASGSKTGGLGDSEVEEEEDEPDVDDLLKEAPVENQMKVKQLLAEQTRRLQKYQDAEESIREKAAEAEKKLAEEKERGAQDRSKKSLEDQLKQLKKDYDKLEKEKGDLAKDLLKLKKKVEAKIEGAGSGEEESSKDGEEESSKDGEEESSKDGEEESSKDDATGAGSAGRRKRNRRGKKRKTRRGSRARQKDESESERRSYEDDDEWSDDDAQNEDPDDAADAANKGDIQKNRPEEVLGFISPLWSPLGLNPKITDKIAEVFGGSTKKKKKPSDTGGKEKGKDKLENQKQKEEEKELLAAGAKDTDAKEPAGAKDKNAKDEDAQPATSRAPETSKGEEKGKEGRTSPEAEDNDKKGAGERDKHEIEKPK